MSRANRLPPTGEHGRVNGQQDRGDQRKLDWIQGPQPPAPLTPRPDALRHARSISDHWRNPKPTAPCESQDRENNPGHILPRNPIMPVILPAYPDVVHRIESKSSKSVP